MRVLNATTQGKPLILSMVRFHLGYLRLQLHVKRKDANMGEKLLLNGTINTGVTYGSNNG